MDKLILSRTFKKLAASSLSAALVIATSGSGRYAAAGGSAPTTVRSVPTTVMSGMFSGPVDLLNHAQSSPLLVGVPTADIPAFRDVVGKVSQAHEGGLTLTRLNNQFVLVPHEALASQLRVGDQKGMIKVGIYDADKREGKVAEVSAGLAALHEALGKGNVGDTHDIILNKTFDLAGKRPGVSGVRAWAGSDILPGGVTRRDFLESMQADFVLIPKGEFWMGSPESKKNQGSDETPHEVVITKPFRMKAHLVTQEEYFALMGRNPSRFAGRKDSDGDYREVNGVPMNLRHPVERVSDGDAAEYANKLSELEGRTVAYRIFRDRHGSVTSFERIPGATGYRLPTEAEWEYAARAGSTTPYPFDSSEIDDHAWHNGNSDGRTHAVGRMPPNAWGLYDMHGNVWEWTEDWYGPYAGGVVADPRGPATGSNRVVRGGSWNYLARIVRSAYRLDDPGVRGDYLGFRLLRSDVDP